jgi:endonuclease-3
MAAVTTPRSRKALAPAAAAARRVRRPRPHPRPDPLVVDRVMGGLAASIAGLEQPAIEKISASQQEDAFQVLIGTLLSARTRDAVTLAASTRLFARARTPRRVARLPVREIERLIYPVSFFRTKAEHVKACCETLVARFGGRVPSTLEELVTLPGVGRKTATLVLILAFRSRQHVCVDTHVHRICNRLGWVRTRAPEETEQAIYRTIDARWWPLLNLYLVTWGQNVCHPVYPRCGECTIAADCPRLDVRQVGKAPHAMKDIARGPRKSRKGVE